MSLNMNLIPFTMETTGAVISAVIASVSGVVAIVTIVRSFLKVRNSKSLTIIKKDGRRITINTSYNRADSRRMMEFIS